MTDREDFQVEPSAVEKIAMSKDPDWDSFCDTKRSDMRLMEVPGRDVQGLVDSAGDGQDEHGQPSVSQLTSALDTTGQLDSFLQRTVNARTLASEVDSLEAWREFATAAGELSEMAQGLAAAAEAKQRAEELAQNAEEASRTAENQARAAAEAKQRAEELAQIAEQANRTAQNQARAAAEARAHLRRLETAATPASGANTAGVPGEASEEVVDARVDGMTTSSGTDQALDSSAQRPAAKQPSAENPHRRLLPRESDSQLGKYRIEDDAQHRWRPCRLTDVSLAGAGLELLETTAAVRKGKIMILKFEEIAQVRVFSGEIFHITETADGTVKIGLRFVELTEATRKHLEWLKEASIRW
ncbi:MAG TPA: PilZ domain-containing protein [Acidimicrobiales bacterium]|nr:PilZ domain-containing protein [Acidimicrobiales bacterium]